VLFQADLALTRSVSAGAYTAIAECGQQFKYETWSCPEEAFYLNDARRAGQIGQLGQGKEGERNNHLALLGDDSNGGSNKKIFKTSRSLKFKALRKGGNRQRVRNNDNDNEDEDAVNNSFNNNNNNNNNFNNHKNSNNNNNNQDNSNSNNQVSMP
jgi:hypothetical protein